MSKANLWRKKTVNSLNMEKNISCLPAKTICFPVWLLERIAKTNFRVRLVALKRFLTRNKVFIEIKISKTKNSWNGTMTSKKNG